MVDARSAGHEPLVDALERLLYRHDPTGIAVVGNPDEYSPEAGTIAPRLAEARSVEDVLRIVHEEFVRWFDDDAGTPTRYRAVAEEIWALTGISEER